MTRAKTYAAACLLLLIVGLLAGTLRAHAQAQPMLKPSNILILSGPDIGFRVEGVKGSSVTGRFVVRVSGKWVEVENAFAAKPVTERH